jgi:pimeloyl-[acyl-carrier protein] methyl ester esterase
MPDAIRNAASSVPQTPVTGELPAPPEDSACPPPLAWTDVLQAFREQSEPFEASTDELRFNGRSMGEGPPLYFLNGLSQTCELFCLTVWLLREQFRCVLIDYPDDARDLKALASLVPAAADHLGDEHFDLCACSFGSSVAIELLLNSPERIRHLVLQGPLVKFRMSRPERLCCRVTGWLPGNIDRLPMRRRVMENNHRLWFPPFDHSRWEWVLDDTGNVPTTAVMRRLRMLHGMDYTDRLNDIGTPALVVSSEGEAFRHRESAAILNKRLPQVQFEELSNCGHLPFATHPHRLANLIRPFLLGEAES